MADELDMPYDRTSLVMGVTDVTVDQGGSGGSDALQTDGWPMRRVAAEARRVLLDMAAARFSVPVAALAVSDGVIAVTADARRVTYGELIGGRRFNVALTGNNTDQTTGQAPLKAVQELKIVGQSPQRYDIPAKVDGSLQWAVDVKLPGMVHARNVRPPVAGATLVSIDESSVRGVPGFVKVVSKGNYVAVVCEREEQAIQAARQLKVNWRKPATAPFPASDDLFTFMRGATPTFSAPPNVVGDPDAALAGAARVVEADYEVPFQGHTSFGPAHAMADPSNDQMTIYSNDMKSYGLRNGVAQLPADAARPGARRLDGRPAGLRPHRRRRRRVRGGVPGEGDRPSGARAVDAAGRDGVGHEGAGLRDPDARRPRRAAATSWRSTTTRAPPITITSATTSSTPC